MPDNAEHLVPITEDQVPELSLKETASATWPWSAEELANSLREGHHCLAYRQQDQIIGYCVLLDAVAAMEILNFVIFKEHQRQGHGSAFLRSVIKFAAQQGAEEMWLEVRESNDAAKALYAAVGFQQGEIREEYYPITLGGLESAILMQRRIGGS